jgi:uncharacterized metal-binding protein
MDHPNTELIFPCSGISPLVTERGNIWQELVATVEFSGPDSHDQIAFILMMARLNNCLTCRADSFRALHGCINCSRNTLKRFHGSDDDLAGLYKNARSEVTGLFKDDVVIRRQTILNDAL